MLGLLPTSASAISKPLIGSVLNASAACGHDHPSPGNEGWYPHPHPSAERVVGDPWGWGPALPTRACTSPNIFFRNPAWVREFFFGESAMTRCCAGPLVQCPVAKVRDRRPMNDDGFVRE